MKQYVIASLLTPETTPLFKRAEFPLHLTLAGPFFSDREFGEIAEKMNEVCANTTTMTLRGTERRMFGRDRNLPGTMIERSPELYALHNNLFDALKGMVTIKVPEHNRAAYNPHVSDRPTGKVLPGQTLVLESVSLLEFLDDNVLVLATLHIV
jgi:2'-5' RNA ligase superfamily